MLKRSVHVTHCVTMAVGWTGICLDTALTRVLRDTLPKTSSLLNSRKGKESAGKSDASSDRNDARRFGGSSMIGMPRSAARFSGQDVRGLSTLKLEAGSSRIVSNLQPSALRFCACPIPPPPSALHFCVCSPDPMRLHAHAHLTPKQLELELILSQMTQKPMLRG